MKVITDFIDSVNAGFTRIGTGISGISEDLDKQKSGIAALDDIISKLQASPGTLSPEDQALLDAAQAQVKILADQAEAAKAKADGIDTTPPTPPAPTPAPAS